jgi:hypothetical protein
MILNILGVVATYLMSILDRIFFYILFITKGKEFLPTDLINYNSEEHKIRNIPVKDEKEELKEETKVFRASLLKNSKELLNTLHEGIHTLDKFFEKCVELYPKKNAIAFRLVLKN